MTSGLGDMHLQLPTEVVCEHGRECEDLVGHAAVAWDVVERRKLLGLAVDRLVEPTPLKKCRMFSAWVVRCSPMKAS